MSKRPDIGILETPAERRAEKGLAKHGIGGERASLTGGERPRAVIDAIIRDVQAANSEAGE
jgi:hypothetical protein